MSLSNGKTVSMKSVSEFLLPTPPVKGASAHAHPDETLEHGHLFSQPGPRKIEI